MKGRPAELTTAGFAGLAATLSVAAHLSRPWTAVVTAAVGLTPGVVSYLIDHQGIAGAVRSLLRGRS